MDFRPIFENPIFRTVLEPFSQPDGQKTKIAFPHLKERSNQKVEENKLALKFNFTLEYMWGGSWFWLWKSHRALLFIPSLRKYQTKATNVTMYCFTYTIWSDIWWHTMGKSPTIAPSVTVHPMRQAILGNIWEHTLEKIPTNATNAIMHHEKPQWK